MSKNNRIKKDNIDLDSMTVQEVDEIANKIGKKVMSILDEGCEKVNKIVAPHNMKSYIDYNTFAVTEVPANLKEDLFIDPKYLKLLNKKDLKTINLILKDVRNRCKNLCMAYQVYPVISYHIIDTA